MTPEEALKTLEDASWMDIDCEDEDEWQKAFELAKDALKRLTPVRPTESGQQFLCPTCGEVLTSKGRKYMKKPHHCRCGQAIDWGYKDEQG